jgi:outer membrane protein assembly factor BamB
MRFAAFFIAVLACTCAHPALAGDGPAVEKNKLTIINEENLAPEIAKIKAHIDKGEWAKAVKAVCETRSKHSGKVFRVDADRCRGIDGYLTEVLESLPLEALPEYRKAFDFQAEKLFLKAYVLHDASLYREVADEYFLSSFADKALFAAAEEAAVRGDFRYAAAALERILFKYPDTNIDRGTLLTALACAYCRTGRRLRAEVLLRGAPAGTVLVAGRVVNYRRRILRFVSAARNRKGTPEAESDGDWPTLAGSPSRDRLPNIDPALGVLVNRIPVPDFSIKEHPPTGFYGRRNAFRRISTRKAFPFFPAFDGRLIYLATGNELITISPETGTIEKIFTIADARLQERNKEIVYAPTVADGMVYTSFLHNPWGGKKHRHIDVTIKIPRRKLVAFDPATSGITFDPASLEKKSIDFDRLIFASAPAVQDGRLYAGVNSLRGFVDNYALAFDTRSGKVLWKRPVCSNIIEITMFGYHAREPVPPMVTEAGGTLYVLTNLGALAAVDAKTGHVRWTVEYEQITVEPPVQYTPRMRKYQWQPTPAVVTGGVVVAAPADSPNFYAWSVKDGSLKWSVRAQDLGEDMYHFLGVSGNCAIVAGGNLAAIDVATGKVRWKTPSIIDMRDSGRGLLTVRSAYHPTPTHLLKFDLDTGKLTARWKWPDPEDAGNVFILGGRLVTTSENGISIFGGVSR